MSCSMPTWQIVVIFTFMTWRRMTGTEAPRSAYHWQAQHMRKGATGFALTCKSSTSIRWSVVGFSTTSVSQSRGLCFLSTLLPCCSWLVPRVIRPVASASYSILTVYFVASCTVRWKPASLRKSAMHTSMVLVQRVLGPSGPLRVSS
jgi:hypothetical protein